MLHATAGSLTLEFRNLDNVWNGQPGSVAGVLKTVALSEDGKRYGIDAAVYKFNCHWIEGLKQPTSNTHRREYGAGLARVFYEYFETVKPGALIPARHSAATHPLQTWHDVDLISRLYSNGEESESVRATP